MLTCQFVFRAYVPACLGYLRGHVPTCLACLRAHVPSCFRGVTRNNKSKFSMTCFTQIFRTFSLSFSSEIKLYMKSSQQAVMSLETFILRIQ